MKVLYDVLVWMMVLVLLLAVCLFRGLPVLGVRLYHLQSGDMEPIFSAGSLLLVVPCSPAEVEVGAAATFALEGDDRQDNTVTLRVTRKDDAGGFFCVVPQQVADAGIDGGNGVYLPYARLVGQVVAALPQMGRMMAFLRTLPGLLVGFAVVLVAVWLRVAGVFFAETAKRAGSR